MHLSRSGLIGSSVGDKVMIRYARECKKTKEDEKKSYDAMKPKQVETLRFILWLFGRCASTLAFFMKSFSQRGG